MLSEPEKAFVFISCTVARSLILQNWKSREAPSHLKWFNKMKRTRNFEEAYARRAGATRKFEKSNSIAAYAHISDNPESFGLYFVLGVCFRLVLTLCLLVIRISCQPRTHTLLAKPRESLKDYSTEEECAGMQPHEEEEESDNNDEAEPLNLTTDIPLVNHSPSNDGTLTVNMFTSAEELERAQRLEERERIIREIWRNGQPDILGTGTGTIGRVHYY
ncbi:protein eva-1 homolog B-like [Lissotriton helveticus]